MNKQRYFTTGRFWLGVLLALAISAAFVYRVTSNHLYALGLGQPPPDLVRFVVIGDYGVDSFEEAAVSFLVDGWTPDLVMTVGDNNYPDGTAATIDTNIGQYYQQYIFPYTGTYGPGTTQNRFFPALGNHDWHTITCVNDACSGAYFDYFTLPGNERYYDFVQGPVHFFVIDSDSHEPDGNSATSIQAAWLQARLAASTARWKFVFMHHAPYSSSTQHGSQTRLQWPYAAWGANAVFAGHDHLYERVLQEGIPYFVNGPGGAPLYTCGPAIPGSQLCYDGAHGAMLVAADKEKATFQFFTRTGQLIDTYTLDSTNLPTPTATPAPGNVLRVSQSSDDAEENVSDGALSLTSSDLELSDDPARGIQLVGLRFQNVVVPQGVTITNAYLEFTVDEVGSAATSLLLHAQAVDHALTFTTTAFDIALRPQTVISVAWENVPAWETVGTKQRTPNLAALVQEIVNRPGWKSGNALAFVISGSGQRAAEAYDKGSAGAALLRVEYPGAPTPTVTPTASMTPTPTPTAIATAPGPSNRAWMPVVRR